MNGTSDSRTDKRNRARKAIETKGRYGCPVCGLHKGCNKRSSKTGRKNKETK